MGRHRSRGWVMRFCYAVAFLVAICASSAGTSFGSPTLPASVQERDDPRQAPTAPLSGSWSSSSEPRQSCYSSAQSSDHFLLVVSTIDGSVSALDMRTNGDLLWSVNVDDRPLLSASITNIQVTRDGVSTRLIPSLDGGLYEFDGEDIKAIPMTAESLLSSSLRLTDNCVMVGGKEVGSYGIDVLTGQLSYQCTSAGCKDTTEAANGGGDMFLITRNMQTVRAVDVNSGSEKWNFSVGQNDLLFVRSQKDKPGLEHDRSVPHDTMEDVDATVHDFCTPSHDDEREREAEEEELKRLIKVGVSEGRIVGLSPEDPSQMAWSRKFSSPVAKAWILHRGKLERISLFDSQVVPSLSATQEPFERRRYSQGDPLLYVGTHNRQLYVQKEELDPDSCEKELPWVLDKDIEEQRALLRAPHVTWRPYLSKADSQTPLFVGNKAPKVPLVGQAEFSGEAKEEGEADSSLMVWNEHYPFDMGYYLYPNRLLEDRVDLNLTPPEEEGIMDVLPASLWIWWKEVAAISILTAVTFHLVITRIFYRRTFIKDNSTSLESKESTGSLVSNDSLPTLADADKEFKSRFADEFECIEQLGKGGYGIVFRARNKVDEQEYAVKRIALPNRDGAVKKKMLREVRTLAVLDHVGIVRYFHSWIEDPPPGWQEERDRLFRDVLGTSEGLSPMTDTTLPSTDHPASSTSPKPLTPNLSTSPSKDNPSTKRRSSPSKQNPSSVPSTQASSVLADIIPFKPEPWDQDFNSHSGEFSMHSNMEGSATDESGSFSLGGGDQRNLGGEGGEESKDSFSVVFQNSEGEPSLSGGGEDVSFSGDSSLPFKHYSSEKIGGDVSHVNTSSYIGSTEDSLSIVFEESRNKSIRDCSESSSVVFEDSRSNANKDCSESSSVVFEHPRGSEANKPSTGSAHRHSKSMALSDSSYGGSVDDNESGNKDDNINNRVTDFTLSSHRSDEDKPAKEEAEKEKRVDDKTLEKKSAPKLYLYLQMQLCRLETLKDWLVCHTLNRERLVVLDIFEQIVSAVDYIHAKGLIHRDLKPSNIFFALDNTVKVGDFGLVTDPEDHGMTGSLADVPSDNAACSRKVCAKHTAEVGTQLYMSPEQIQKKPYDQKVDIFSLGLIFLELLMPFSTGMERVTTLQNARKGLFPERFSRELPVESALVRQLMSTSPQRRPLAQEILDHPLLQDLPAPRRTPAPRYRTISSSSNHSDPALTSEL